MVIKCTKKEIIRSGCLFLSVILLNPIEGDMYKFFILHGEKFSLGGVDEICFSRDEVIQECYTPFSMQ